MREFDEFLNVFHEFLMLQIPADTNETEDDEDEFVARMSDEQRALLYQMDLSWGQMNSGAKAV